jgi:hypothetical protein
MLCLLPNKVYWLVPFFCMSLLFTLFGQQTDFVVLSSPSELNLVPGEEQKISLSFRIKEGFHIQADEVKDENLIPSHLIFEHSPELTIGEPIFPQSKEFWMEGSEEALLVFSDLMEITVPINSPPSVDGIVLKGILHYQACDASKCYFPRNLEFVLKLNID